MPVVFSQEHNGNKEQILRSIVIIAQKADSYISVLKNTWQQDSQERCLIFILALQIDMIKLF